jgi:DNA-binding SARP family transcriptional activator/tetratricopeptide (TPR) repeat protein
LKSPCQCASYYALTTKPIEIRLLGRFEVLRGTPLELPPSKKARALLAYLVATERAHERGHLAGLLWDERDDARGALRWALSRLRPVLDDQLTRLTTDRDLVAFERGDADVDLTSVRLALRPGIDHLPTATLEQAASRFRGELLEGLELSDCYGFHAWCIAEREAARALRGSILSALVDRHADDPERALPFARTRLDLDPLAGASQACVVRILGALGRLREAEELYESFKHMVHARLGERTSSELERARIAIRRTRQAVPAVAAEPAALQAPVASTALARLARSPFVGRERELGTLTTALEGAVAGGGAFFEIAGEAGMGKSRLVDELAHQARLRGARVLVGRCLEGDGSPAFLPFLDSLDAALGDEADLERLAGADAALAARLFPRIAARLGQAPAPSVAHATSERYLVFQAVATLLERVAAPAGAVLVIEDLHWIDQPSLALLRYLAGRLDGMRLLVVATYRDEDLDSRRRDALVDLRRDGASRVSLRGLAKADVVALVTALGGADVPPALCEQLAEATGGQPLFLQEMLKHLVEENALVPGPLAVPEGVRQVIGRRLTHLSERAKRLLTLVSPMIGAFRWELVREVSKENEDELLDALEEVLGAQLLQEGVSAGFVTYEFSHRLVAQVLYESLPLPRRARVNRQIAEAIERLHESDLDPHVPALAHHFFMAVADGSGKAKAAEYALRAAERAASLVAFEEAARYYQRAAELLTAEAPARLPEIHRQRGRALAIVSSWSEACEAYELALANAQTASSEWRAEVLVELGSASLWAMNMPAVYTRAREADALVRSLGREDLTLAVGGMLAQCLASGGELTAAIEKYTEVRSLQRDRHVPSLALAPLTLYWNGCIDDAIGWAHETLAAARKASDIVSLLVGLPPLGMALAASGRYREARATFAEARAIGERARATSLLARAVSMSTGFHLDLGDIDTAEDLASEAYELGRLSGWSPGTVSAGIDLVTCRLRRGDVGGAEQLLEQTARTAAEIGGRKPGASGFHDFLWSIRLAWARAELAATRGLYDEVERWCADALALAAGGRPKYEVAALVTRARSSAEQGRRAAALADLDRALLIARGSRDPALFLRVAVPRCALDGNAELDQEIRGVQQQIEASR